eukprot:904940_1
MHNQKTAKMKMMLTRMPDQFNSLSNLCGADSLHEEKSFDAFAIGTMRGPMDLHSTNEANDDYREENEAQQEEKQKIEQERWQQFYKQEITASAIQKELESMFDNLQARRDAK